MPCYDPVTGDELRQQYEASFTHNSKVADALCELCQSLERRGIKLTPKAAVWWKAHKARDRKRTRQERVQQRESEQRRRALAKLSPAERRLLGVRQ